MQTTAPNWTLWAWAGNDIYEILRQDKPDHILARVAKLSPDRWRWRAFDGEQYSEGVVNSEAAAKSECARVCKLA